MKKNISESFNNIILNKFSSETAELLIEFNKYLSTLDEDYIIFMARKALRLYELLVLIGSEQCKKLVLSDHVLDQNLTLFENKTVALIDDTLILGTTLARSKKVLLNAGAKKVTTHVFATDSKYWCKELVTPEKYFIDLNHENTLTFCAAEVDALATAAIPYLTDFPFSRLIRIKKKDIYILQGMTGWETYNLTTPSQEIDNVSFFSLLPTSIQKNKFINSVHFLDSSLFDILKIRIFIRQANYDYILRIVPIVTLKTLNIQNIDSIFFKIVDECFSNQEISKKQIINCLQSSISKLRFSQYIFSSILGNLFFKNLQDTLGLKKIPEIDTSESIKHFGYWLKDEFEIIDRFVKNKTLNSNPIFSNDKLQIIESEIPSDVIDTVQKDFQNFDFNKKEFNYKSRTLLTDLMQAFKSLYINHEIPIRKTVHEYKQKILDMDSKSVPHRERLNYGFPWKLLVNYLSGITSNISPEIDAKFSLLLDYLIDMGIAVPIITQSDNVVFRAYRHGEDVLFGDQEIGLVYDAMDGFLTSINNQSMPKLHLEKLIVLLIRIGASRKFLKVIHGATGSEGVARIGYHLHGAVPFIREYGIDTYFANNDTWLSRYMLDREIILEENMRYKLGYRPEIAVKEQNATHESKQIGLLFGLLLNNNILDNNKLTLLASCYSPRDITGALEAELRIVLQWYDTKVKDQIERLDINNLEAVEEFYFNFTKGSGYIAIHSAKMKFLGYINNINKQTIQECSKYLESLEHGIFLSSNWNMYWNAISTSISFEKEQRFEPLIQKLAKSITTLALGLFTIEASLARIFKKSYEKIDNKIYKYLTEITLHQKLVKREQTLYEQLLKIVENNLEFQDLQKNLPFANQWIKNRRLDIYGFIQESSNLLIDFGRNHKRNNYKFVVWYDIMDSLGKNQNKEELLQYRKRIERFKEAINSDLIHLMNSAKADNSYIHDGANSLTSTDDEKHLFFSENRSLEWLKTTLRLIFNRCETYGVNVRIIAINADFTGIPPYYYDNDADAKGETFFEHFSRIKQGLEYFEKNEIKDICERPLFWVTREMRNDLGIEEFLEVKMEYKKTIKETIDHMQVTSNMIGGFIDEVID